MTSRFSTLRGMAPPCGRHALAALLGLTLLSLSACGGGGGGAAPSTATPEPEIAIPTTPPVVPGGGGGGGGGGATPSGPPLSGFVPTATLSQSASRTLELQDRSTNAGGQVSQSPNYTLINEGVTP